MSEDEDEYDEENKIGYLEAHIAGLCSPGVCPFCNNEDEED